MSKHKAAGKLRIQERPRPKYLGVKVADGEKVTGGSILIKQRGTKYHAGGNVKVGLDHTLFSIKEGVVKFSKRLGKTLVSVK